LTPTDTASDTVQETPEQTLDVAEQDTPEHAAVSGHDHDHVHHAPALNPELTRSIEVEAPAAEVSKAFRQVIKRYTNLARIPGFRAGKVPEALIKSRFAKEVRQEVLESLVSEKFRHALLEQKVQPVSQPQVSEMQLFDGQPLKFKATFETLPEFSIDVLDHHAVVEPVEDDRAISDGDWAEIGFKGQVQELAQTVGEDGVESKSEGKEITGEDVLIEIGGKNTLQAFNEALRGARVGQELAFEATYPPEFGDARLAGRTVSYDVTVKSIKKKTFPERDEEFAKQLGPYTDWNDFETQLRERASSRKKNALESQARDKMVEELIAKYSFPVPETFVQQQIDARLERGLRALAQQGMSSDAMRQLDFGRLREAQRDQAINEVKASLILDKVAEHEHVTVSDEDMERELLMLSIQSREPLDALRKRLTEDGSLDRIREQMRREKTGAVLFDRLAS